MNAKNQKILDLIEQGEGLTVEFKECKQGLSSDIYETVCAFLNRFGGNILLGINDKAKITGLNRNRIPQIKKDLVNTLNNPQKINPPSYLFIEEVKIGSKLILNIFVPESSQVHRCKNRIYDRYEDGDFDITDHTRQVTELYNRKQVNYTENKIYPHAGLNDIRTDLLEKIRIMVRNRKENHPWLAISDMDLLKSAQLYQKNHETGESGLTLAGILLLGRDEVILSVVPHHKTDLILRKLNLDRYDDRDDVRTNLIDSFDRIMTFIAKHLPDPFYLEHNIRISLRDAIFREVASNLIIHREFINPFPAKLIIEKGIVRTENSNKPHGFGIINPDNFSPFPKNPVISRFFREIGRADELGSGVRNMMKYGKNYGGENPQLIEEDIFKMIVSYPDYEKSDKKKVQDGVQVEDQGKAQAQAQVEAQAEQILKLLQKRRYSARELLEKLNLRSRSGSFKKTIRLLIETDLIEYTEPVLSSPKQKYQITEKGKKKLKRRK